MMHAGSDGQGGPTVWRLSGKVQFTNIMSDVRKNPKNLFDVNLDDKGTCVEGQDGGITTYSTDWSVYTGHREAYCSWTGGGAACKAKEGYCLYGDSHSLCSANRDGQRFSNNGTKGCEGSGADTVYWAWSDDDHNCGPHTGVDNKAFKTCL